MHWKWHFKISRLAFETDDVQNQEIAYTFKK